MRSQDRSAAAPARNPSAMYAKVVRLAMAVLLAASSAQGQPVNCDLRSASFFVVGDGGTTYDPPLSAVVSFAMPDGVRLFPTLGTLSGHPLAPNAYASMSQTGFHASGGIVGPITVGSRLRIHYVLSFVLSGGRVDVSGLSAAADHSTASAYGFESALPGSVSSGVPLSGSFDTDAFAMPGTDGSWSVDLTFAWLDYAETDTFRLDTPGSRVDVEIVAPPPAVACCRGASCSLLPAGECVTAGGSFQVASTTCGSDGNPIACCRANFNGLAGVTVQDLFDFLTAYFSIDPRADINGSGGIGVQDIFDFLALYFAGCD